MNHLPVLFGYHASGIGNSHVALSLCYHWDKKGLGVRLYLPSIDDEYYFPWVFPAARGIKKKLLYRFGGDDAPRKAVIRKFSQREKNAEVVYLWAALPMDVFQYFHARGTAIVVERINCHQGTARKILLARYEQLGLKASCPISEQDVAREKEKLALCDAVFCPSPMVRKSMLENGVPEDRLLSTSYGWDPARFPGRRTRPSEKGKPVFLFVGTLCVRKGIPLLLEAWQKAAVDGELILCGAIDDEVREHFGHLLDGENIRYMPYTRDIGKLYSQAHVFVFPTLEEGGPMVTYEAMAHSIPPLVTRMGAGAVARDGVDALILPDDDPDAWSEAFVTMATDVEKRLALGRQAEIRAMEFTWQETAARRADLLQGAFPTLWR